MPPGLAWRNEVTKSSRQLDPELGLKIMSKVTTLRIMGPQNCWFGDPRTLLYTSKALYSRVQ